MSNLKGVVVSAGDEKFPGLIYLTSDFVKMLQCHLLDYKNLISSISACYLDDLLPDNNSKTFNSFVKFMHFCFDQCEVLGGILAVAPSEMVGDDNG